MIIPIMSLLRINRERRMFMYSVNTIRCPHCKEFIEPWDYVETGDMEGEFDMDCEYCNKSFNVSFTTDIRFTTSE